MSPGLSPVTAFAWACADWDHEAVREGIARRIRNHGRAEGWSA